MKRYALTLVAATAFILFGYQVPARANSITYVQSTVASGALGATTFTNKTVTLTLTADTSGVAPAPGDLGTLGLLMNIGTATVNIAGVGTATITDTVGVFSTYNMSAADILLLSDGASSLPVVLIGTLPDFTHILLTSNAAFFGYGLATAIGPITGSGFPCCSSEQHHTTMGNLIFSNTSTRDITFSATTSVPEPASVLLLGTGVLFLFGLHFRERRSLKGKGIPSQPSSPPIIQ